MRLLVGLLSTAVVFGTVELTEDTFEDAVYGGKNAFVKFLKPSRKRCKRMKPLWDKLAERYADSEDVLIADVDCTSEGGKPICEEHEVSEYPTLKYWVSGEKHDYQGGVSYENLEKFTEENLATFCSITKLEESCEEKEIKYYEKMKGEGMTEIKKQYVNMHKMKKREMSEARTKWLHQKLHILHQMIDAAMKKKEKQEL